MQQYKDRNKERQVEVDKLKEEKKKLYIKINEKYQMIHSQRRFYSQMLLLSGERVREGFDTLWSVGIYFWVERSCDFVNEQSDLLHHITALFHVINLQRKQNKYI